ncbi:MAG: RNA methyltransferase [bacterium]
MSMAAPDKHKTGTQTLYGLKACLAMLEHRPDDLVRLYHAAGMRRQLRGMLSWAAARHIPYRELDAEALGKVAKSAHHEGIVVVCHPLRHLALTPDAAGQAARAGEVWMALDGVSNPHNLGAIVRSCAFFGVGGLLAGGASPQEKVNAAVPRVAEGGAEHVRFFAAPEFPTALRTLGQAGFRVIGLETDGGRPLEEALANPPKNSPKNSPENSPASQALTLVLGQEREGLSREARRACGEVCRIERGSMGGGGTEGALSSLNVSVTAGVALAAVLRGR